MASPSPIEALGCYCETGQKVWQFASALSHSIERAVQELPLMSNWNAVADKVNGELRILVPTRNYCLFCGADAPVIPVMSRFASSLFEEAGHQGLSKAVFSIRDGNIVVS